MGRIDEAIRRTTAEEPAAEARTTPNLPVPADVFTSPWTFEDGATREDAEGATPGTPRPPVADIPAISRDPGQMAIFRGFKAEVLGRIVAAPGAPPLLTEQFRRLAATLHHAQLVQGTKIVMVTSANPGDGKSLTSANLALTLSESYRREVLLIDADLRRPSLHDIFRVPNVSGLNDGLKANQDGKLSVIQITDTLTLLPAGRPDPDPMSSLTSARMAEILREATNRFHWIIIDTAPLGLLTDASLLSTMVDGALLVIRAGQTPHAAVLRAVESLGRDRLIGVVLNGIEDAPAQNDYYTRGTDAASPAPPAPPAPASTALTREG